MKITDEEFLQLQQHWYKMLEQNGFKDLERVENGERTFEYVHTFNVPIDDVCRNAKEEFYNLLGQIINDDTTKYKNELEKYVMYHYWQGISTNTISKQLKKMGIGRTQRTVFRIVDKYLREWNLKK